ncbi:MAG: glycosyltransferase [Planctomycetota bacterium]
MKLLHVLTTLDVGGAEMHVLCQVRGQVARGHSVRLVYLKGEGTLARDFLDAGAEEVVHAPLGPRFPFRLSRHARWADLVHSHLLKADAVTAVSALLLGFRKKLVSGKHNDERALLRPAVSRVHGLLGRIPARTIVLSDHVGRFMEEHGRVPRARQERVYYGLDPTPFEAAAADASARAARREEFGYAPDDVVFVCVARFAPQKAHEVLIDAAARAHERNPCVRLLLVGDDPFGDGRQRAERVARERGVLDTVVRFTGIRRDVPALMAASDVFTMASRWEGLGLVFLEAMATSLPVLSTQVSAIPEVVLADETGLLVPPDDAEALAEGMLRLAADADLRARLGRAGRARVLEHFGLDRMVDETLDIYRDVVAG